LAGLCPNPLGELTVLLRPSSLILGIGLKKGKEKRRKGRERQER